MSLSLVSSENPCLREPCTMVNDIRQEVVPYFGHMLKLMKKHKGVGLAAPQVGISTRFFVSKIKGCQVAINPEIFDSKGEIQASQEGCLSFPGKRVEVKRHETILCEFTNLKGNRLRREFTGFEARIFQHEIDHLNGICIVKEQG